jgi:hypothetical protein
MIHWEKYKVDVPEGQSGNWRVERFVVTERDADLERIRSAFASSARRIPVPAGHYTRLMHGTGFGALVMSDTPAEMNDHRYAIHLAKGKVLVNGLGLGVVVQAMLEKPEVDHLTVIEISPDVIALVGDHYKERYGDRVEIIEADALTWKAPKGVRYDVVWHDIWKDICADNLPEMHKLHRKYGRRADWQGSWCRAECEWQRG